MIDRLTIAGLRADRTTESGRRCVDVAAALISQCEGIDDRGGARALTEIMREARGWVKLALDCDAAAHHARLADVHQKLAEREAGADSIVEMRAAFAS